LKFIIHPTVIYSPHVYFNGVREGFAVPCGASHLKEKDVIFFKRKPKKESPSVKEGGKGCQVFL
jgi:hypothetical protein